MEEKLSMDLFCQSCGMPMQKDQDHGTEANEGMSEDYCAYCYQDGKFTMPNATVEEMIDVSVAGMKKAGVDEAIIEQSKILIPQLKRWKKE